MALKYTLKKQTQDEVQYWVASFANGADLRLPVEVAKTEKDAAAYIDENYSNDPDFTRTKKQRDADLAAMQSKRKG